MNSCHQQKSSELRVSDLPLRITRKIAQLLDPPHARDWRYLAEKLGMSHRDMEYIQNLFLPNYDGSNTLKMLNKAEEILGRDLDLTLEEFKDILKSIGRLDVVRLIEELDENGEFDDIRKNKSKRIKRNIDKPGEDCDFLQDPTIDSSNTAIHTQCVSCQKRMKLNSYHSVPISPSCKQTWTSDPNNGDTSEREYHDCFTFYSDQSLHQKNGSLPPREYSRCDKYMCDVPKLPGKLRPYHDYCLPMELKAEEDECSLVVNHETCLSQNVESFDPHRMPGAVVSTPDSEHPLPLHVGIGRTLDQPIDYSKKGNNYSSPMFLTSEEQLLDYSNVEDVITTNQPVERVLDMRKKSRQHVFHVRERKKVHSSSEEEIMDDDETSDVPWQNLDKTKLKNMSYMKGESNGTSELCSRSNAKSKTKHSGTYPRSRRCVDQLEEQLNGKLAIGNRPLQQKQKAEYTMNFGSVSSPAYLNNQNRKAPKKVFVTFTHDSERHVRHVLSLVKNMKDNKLNVSSDQFDHKMTEENKIGYLENLCHSADFIVAVVSDKYRQVVESSSNKYQFTDENPIRSLHARFIFKLMKKEWHNTGGETRRFRLIYFPQDCHSLTVPPELKHSKIYSWDKDGYKDFYYSLREANKVMSKHCAVNEY